MPPVAATSDHTIAFRGPQGELARKRTCDSTRHAANALAIVWSAEHRTVPTGAVEHTSPQGDV